MKNCYLIILILGCLIGCIQTEYNLTPSVTGYPLRVGTKWIYARQVIIREFESPSSDSIVAVDTLNSEVFVWIDQDVELKGKTVKVFNSKEGDSESISSRYMLYDKEGLKTFAYRNPTINAIAGKSRYLKSPLVRQTYSDTILFETSPVLDLQLPLLPDSSWTYKYATAADSLQIDKAVTGTETLTLTGMKINCYKLDWIYLNDSTYRGYQTTEWFSEKGLMKRVVACDRVTLTDENDQPLYEGQYTETLTLKSFRYK